MIQSDKIIKISQLIIQRNPFNYRNAGFTLAEMILTVAIIAIMAGAVSVGIHSFSNTISAQSTTGLLEDVLHELSMEVVLKEYQKSSVYFNSSHLLVDSKYSESSLSLNWQKILFGDPLCPINSIKLTSSDSAKFFARDDQGSLLEGPKELGPSQVVCINPVKYKVHEVIYNLESEGEFSNKIRIFPINLDEDSGNDVMIMANTYVLKILPPYGKKQRYKEESLIDDETEAELTIQSTNGNSTAVFNLPKN